MDNSDYIELQKRDMEMLQKRVAALESTLIKTVQLLTDQGKMIQKLAEAIAVIFKKITADNNETKGDTPT